LPDQSSPTRPGHGEFEGVAAHYDHLMRLVPYRGWVDYIESILQRWKVSPSRVLDLACGTGRVGSEMRRRGYDAVGADLSEPMVHECRKQDPPLPGIVSDARSLAFADGSFDLIVCLYDSLNYILELEGLASAIAEAYRVLRPGGLFIFDLNTTRALSTDMFSQTDLSGRDPLRYDWHAHWDCKTKICRVEMWFGYRDETGEREFVETHYQRAYTFQEVTGSLKNVGFRRYKTYDAYRFSPLTPWSDRAFYVAQRNDS